MCMKVWQQIGECVRDLISSMAHLAWYTASHLILASLQCLQTTGVAFRRKLKKMQLVRPNSHCYPGYQRKKDQEPPYSSCTVQSALWYSLSMGTEPDKTSFEAHKTNNYSLKDRKKHCVTGPSTWQWWITLSLSTAFMQKCQSWVRSWSQRS